jgi:hypothetical protein
MIVIPVLHTLRQAQDERDLGIPVLHTLRQAHGEQGLGIPVLHTNYVPFLLGKFIAIARLPVDDEFS